MRTKTITGVVMILVITAVSGHGQDRPGIRSLAATLHGSGCDINGVETGDPAKTPSIIVEKFAPGCAIPWHWHTPNEHVMMVTGTFAFEVEGEKPVDVKAGDFVFIPSHRVSQTTCVGSETCVNFLYTDAPLDIHFVDEHGSEISAQEAFQRYAKTHPKGR